MNKKIVIIIIVVLIIFGGYFGYKGYNLYKYNSLKESKEIINNYSLKETININHKEINEKEYLDLGTIKIKNEFKNFNKLDQNQSNEKIVKYVLDNSNTAFWYTETRTFIDSIKSESILNESKIIKLEDINKLLKDNNITNDIELFKFLERNKSENINIFTSNKKMREYYTINFITSILLPTIDNTTIITGDYEGYIFNKQDIKIVNIIKNNKRYILTFLDTKYFTNDKINNLIKTIVIN